MAHLGQFFINTEHGYKKLSDETGITFQDGKTYVLQIQNSAYILASKTEPERGGFYISNPDMFTWTKPSGEDLWIKSYGAIVNISE